MKHLYYLLPLFCFGLIVGCTPEEDPEEIIVLADQFSVDINGTTYSYEDFEIKTEWLESQNRLFFKKEEGENTFTMNFPLDLSEGDHGMDWNNGGVWFFMETADGAFYSLDESTCTMTVVEIDTMARTIHGTFEGIGTQALSTDTAIFDNGVIRASY